jgi:deoxyribodipyrimidine photolyase-related protein
MSTVRLILGDQLNSRHSWFERTDPDVVYLMAEMRQETDYVRHHIQKVVGFFAAMRAFKEEMTSRGHRFRYFRLDNADNPQHLTGVIRLAMEETGAKRFEYQRPDEYRLERMLADFAAEAGVEVEMVETEHFLSSDADFDEVFPKRKNYLMERFYRHMRQKHNVLMDGSAPEGGKWNYDHDNRERLPAGHRPPDALTFERDVSDLVRMVESSGVSTIGSMDARHFPWPVTPAESLRLLEYFAKDLLPLFGRFQDAMTPGHPYLYHSRLSFSLNTKMISPLEVIERCVVEYRARPDEISLPQIEGFVRQILGWREYMRGIYRQQMPGYALTNFFDHRRELPSWFWTGRTRMACLRHAIGQSLGLAYAHHIQRLMLTGNFMLLAGIHPDEADQWYLGIYMDAIEWVEMPNTRGMRQWADGGLTATKPYVSSGQYVKKMSHYCGGCYYRPDEKTGERACPLNALYWHFHHRHRPLLENNHRLGMVYRTWDRMNSDHRMALLQKAEQALEGIEGL